MRAGLLQFLIATVALVASGCVSVPVTPDNSGTGSPAPTPAKDDCGEAPTYTKDPNWPPMLPNGWSLGNIAGIAVGPDDNVWAFQRAGVNAGDGGVGGVGTGPPVIQFDPNGRVLQGWGGPGTGYDWPDTEHGIGVDGNGDVWVSGNGAADHQLIKFAKDGKFLLQIGGKSVSEGSNDVDSVRGAADVAGDGEAIYVADGYGNKRVISFGLDGTYRAHWGAYGNVPDDDENDPAKQFGGPVHGIALSDDGVVFVGDRELGRVHAFWENGTFIREYIVPPSPRDPGKAFDVELVRPEEDFLVFADAWLAGGNDRVVIVCRWSGELAGEIYGAAHPTVGGPGAPLVPGQVTVLHALAADSKGNLYLADMFHGGTGGSVHKLVRGQ
ncbi:MAG TPA: hypothetical protein VGB18_09685 [Candidatus Thermoplasmatota archaeon]